MGGVKLTITYLINLGMGQAMKPLRWLAIGLILPLRELRLWPIPAIIRKTVEELWSPPAYGKKVLSAPGWN